MQYFGKAYKYRSFGGFDDEIKKRIRRTFIEKKIYFSGPNNVNDPLDCSPDLSWEPSELRKYVIDLSKKNGHKLTSAQISGTMHYFIINAKENYFQTLMSGSVSIYCMSKNPSLSTQWAYYGGNHTGYCIEFEIDRNFTSPCVAVEYSSARPSVDLVKFQTNEKYCRDTLIHVVRQKCHEWEKEEEVRALQAKEGLYEVPPESITGVIFGMRTTIEHKEFIKDVLDESGINPRLFEIEQVKASYELHKKPLF